MKLDNPKIKTILENNTKDYTMSVAKNIEISSSSTVSFEDAIKKGIAQVNKTVNNVEGAWIKEQKVRIKDGNITSYNVMMIVSFVIEDDSTDLK